MYLQKHGRSSGNFENLVKFFQNRVATQTVINIIYYVLYAIYLFSLIYFVLVGYCKAQPSVAAVLLLHIIY